MHKVLAVAIVILAVIGIAVSLPQKASPLTSRDLDLDRPLVVGVTSWPGYAGGIMANRGFAPNPDSIYYSAYGLPVKFVLIDDIDTLGKAFARGGPDGVDIVWATVDSWANTAPAFLAGGVDARAFMQVDWSRGGDALVADAAVQSVDDLRGKKIALTQFTPSHWLLEHALRTSSLSGDEQESIRKSLIFTQDQSSARVVFTSGQADATVTWEPDVQTALKRPGAHVLVSSKDFPELIADVMAAKSEFIEAHPRALEAFVRGWFDGVKEAKRDPGLAARYLMENEPLFMNLGLDATVRSFDWVQWSGMEDNVRLFGLNGSVPLFDSLFNEAGNVWRDMGAIDGTMNPTDARETSILLQIQSEQ